MSAGQQPVALLLETPGGDTVGVRFATRELAREWEDRNGVTAVGCVDIVTLAEAVLRGVLE